ncbi:MAG: HAMP domain-containing protein [Acidobacteria bacterium]|nr:HAMP domain-containing protein [Acidobacteriota bacterium]
MSGRLRLSLQYKLFLAFVLIIIVPISVVTYVTTKRVSRQFQDHNRDLIRSIMEQMVRAYQRYGTSAVAKMEKASHSREIQEISARLSLTDSLGTTSIFEALTPEQITESAKQVGGPLDLDVFTILTGDGTIISSSHYPERFGYKNAKLLSIAARQEGVPFLIQEETANDTILTVQAIQRIALDSATKSLIIAGGYRLLRQDFLELILSYGKASLLFYDIPKKAITRLPPGRDGNPTPFAQSPDLLKLARQISEWPNNPLQPDSGAAARPELQAEISLGNSTYMFTGIPLIGVDGAGLGVLLIGLSQADLYRLLRKMTMSSTIAAAIGILSALLLSILFALRVTRPVKELSRAVRSVALGNLDQTIGVTSHDEIGMLGAAFNKMALDLKDNREKLIQIERVAAWREMARRLAHELKNPLFPIQVSVETMIKAEQRTSTEFSTIFAEGTQTILEEVESLKSIIKEFSEFARMPKPVFGPTSVNQVVKQTLLLFNPQLRTIRLIMDLDDHLPLIMADKDQLGRLIKNLVSNALEAMGEQGSLTVKTHLGSPKVPVGAGGTSSLASEGAAERASGRGIEELPALARETWVTLQIGDTGEGLSEEAKQRLFTPYYTTKPKGTGLGLAIVQSIVADHNGKISVDSAVGQGTTFEIELPISQPSLAGTETV